MYKEGTDSGMVQLTSVSPSGHADLPDRQLNIQRLFLQVCNPQAYAQNGRAHDKESVQRKEGLPQISVRFLLPAAAKGGGESF